jgi:hypothetical protein
MQHLTMMDSSTKEKELLQLAMQEGHDADIPSNAGVITDAHVVPPQLGMAESVKSPAESTFGKDVEKDMEKGIILMDTSARDSTNSDEAKGAPSENDANIVDWDGDDDPVNPMNWPAGRKWGETVERYI